MNGISLFSGIGGLDLAIKRILPQSKTLLYCEGEIYCSKILQSLFKKGYLEEGIIYSDVKSLLPILEQFNTKIHFITAGFPCQPFSLASAGKRKGIDDHRFIWHYMEEIFSTIRPNFLFLENVANILNDEATHLIFKSLAKLGYDIEWATLRAADVGANHKRERLFIFAYLPTQTPIHIFDPVFKRCSESYPTQITTKEKIFYCPTDEKISDSNGIGCLQSNSESKEDITNQFNSIWNPNHWRNEDISPFRRVDDGFPFPMDSIRALGNAVVPFQGSVAFYYLMARSNLNTIPKSRRQ